MFYNNLIYLLIVILLFSTSGISATPQLPPLLAFPLFVGKAILYILYVVNGFRPGKILASAEYFRREQQHSILAIILVAVDIYLLDCKYYLTMIPFTDRLPVLVNVAGVLLFFAYLATHWAAAARSYGEVFHRQYRRQAFIVHNIKMNLPIILPWFILSLAADALSHFDIPFIQPLFHSPWGEPILLLFFFLVLAIIFPAIITKLWNCTPLPPGELRNRIEQFCRQQQLRYAEILSWPLFEGQVITAGVMGFIRPFRYLLITPALIRTMSHEEIEAVMAHEIGHVKRYHLQLYFLLFLGFGALVQLSAYPFIYLLSTTSVFYEFIHHLSKKPSSILTLVGTIPLIILLIVYFRFIFGFFMRNFERQADLYVFRAMGTSRPLVQVLDKIAWLNGNIRDVPSWHHFGIGERIDYLEKCEKDNKQIARQDRKVAAALAGYLLFFAAAGVLLWQLPKDFLERAPLERYEAIIEQKAQEEPENPLWHQLLGDFQYSRKLVHKAIRSYGMVLALDPNNAEVLNNLAWLLLTVENELIYDPRRALALAMNAARLNPSGYILDTLATAYWKNDMLEKAMETEQKAIEKDPENKRYYLDQLKKFITPAEIPRL